jgi:hypothetical protein
MDFLVWLCAVFWAAFRLSIDATQGIVFLAIVCLETIAIFVRAGAKPAMKTVSAYLTTGRGLLIVFIAVIVTRMTLAPYWVWEDEHQARLTAEAKNKELSERAETRLAIKGLLSDFLNEGEAMLSSHKESKEQSVAEAYRIENHVWANKAGNLIEAVYGKGERTAWLSDFGALPETLPDWPTFETRMWLSNRLQRLDELIKRADTITIRADFDPAKYHLGD